MKNISNPVKFLNSQRVKQKTLKLPQIWIRHLISVLYVSKFRH